MTVRTRFAPSPTGYLHIGSARTALFNWLFAKKHGGTFVLRVEDTDLERSTSEASDAILEAMDWLGLDYQEGPFYQSKRLARYQEVVELLLEKNLAYRCYCSKERLEHLRKAQEEQKLKPKYDGLCRQAQHIKDAPYTIRFKNPLTGNVVFNDLIRGQVVVNNAELDDLIILRSDGIPTYNFAVVIDDWDMQITHVIRGEDHLTNTSRQINLFNALNAPIPTYAHLSMILGGDGKRLSKRHGAVSVQYYQELGILPHALLNYLVRLGWSHKDQELFTREEMINYFGLQEVQKSAAQFNLEKLLWVNQQYLKEVSAEVLQAITIQFNKRGITEFDPPISAVLQLQLGKFKTTKEFVEQNLYFYQEPSALPLDLDKNLIAQVLAVFKGVDVSSWHKEELHAILQQLLQQLNLKLPELAKPLRLILTGSTSSPSLDATLAVLGRKKTISRLERFLLTS